MLQNIIVSSLCIYLKKSTQKTNLANLTLFLIIFGFHLTSVHGFTPLYHLRNRASSSPYKLEQLLHSLSSSLNSYYKESYPHYRTMRQHMLKKSDSSIETHKAVKKSLDLKEVEPSLNTQKPADCPIFKSDTLHEVIDRVCEMCHDMYSYQIPNMRSECR